MTPRTQTRRTAVALGAIVALSALGCWVAVRHVTTWSLMTDEIFWSKLATSLGDGRFPPVVRADDSSTSLLYPLVLSPLFRLFDTPSAFHAAHAVNVVLMASTAVPAYLLCRRLVVSPPLALVAAAITVAVPWMALSTMLLTESLGYPASVWALLAMQRALVTPGPRTLAWTALALVAAYLARTQLIVLSPVFPAAALATCLAQPPGEQRRTALARHRTLWLACAGALAALVVLAITGRAGALLGNYRSAAGGLTGSARDYLGTTTTLGVTVALGVGILPLVAALAWAPVAVRRGDTPDRLAFAVLGSIAGMTLLGFAAVYVTTYNGGDRYAFYLAPVLVLAAAAALEDRRMSGARYAGAGLLVAVLALVADLPDLIFHASPVATFYPVLEDWARRLLSPLGLAPGRNLLVAAGAGAAAVALTAVARVGTRAAVPALGAVLLFCCLATGYALDRGVENQVGGVKTVDGMTGWGDWIDRSAGRDASVGLVVSPAGDAYNSGRIWWDTEFWNESVNRVYVAPGEDDYAAIRERALEIDPDTGRATTPWSPDLVLASSDLSFRPAGRLLATTSAATQFPNPRLELWKTSSRTQSAWTSTGIRRDGWVAMGTAARIRAFDTRADGRAAVVRIGLTLPLEIEGPRTYDVSAPGVPSRGGEIESFASGVEEQVAVCVAAGGFSDVLLSPKGGAVTDPALGLRVSAISVESASDCPS